MILHFRKKLKKYHRTNYLSGGPNLTQTHKCDSFRGKFKIKR